MDLNDPDAIEEDNLITQIELEMRKVYLLMEKLHNNAPLSDVSDPIEKCFINDYYFSSCLLQRGMTDGLDRYEDILKTFEESLKNELNSLTSDMDKLLIRINEYKEQFKSIDQNTTNLKEMIEAQKNLPKPDQKFDVISKNIKMRFRKEKADLKSLVGSLFPDSIEVQDLIARIVEHHFSEGSDKYLQLEDAEDIIEQIELLRRIRLIETNPRDPLQIRLADLV